MLHFKETLTRYSSYQMTSEDYLRKDAIVLNYLEKHYGNTEISLRKVEKTDSSKIWVFWYQGEESMPPLVKATYASIKANANGHEVVLITGYNIDQFLNVPEIIKQKVAQNKITLAQYSDIIRASLLAEYGGLWIDATVLVTEPIPESVFNADFFTIKNLPNKKDPLFYISVAHLRWTTYVFGGKKSNPLFQFMKMVLIKYNSQESALIDYLLIDYVIELGLKHLPETKSLLDKISITNPGKEELVHRLNAKYPDKITRQLLNGKTHFFKLSYKIKENTNSQIRTNYQLITSRKILDAYQIGDER